MWTRVKRDSSIKTFCVFSHVHLHSCLLSTLCFSHVQTLAQRCCHFNVVIRDALTTAPETFLPTAVFLERKRATWPLESCVKVDLKIVCVPSFQEVIISHLGKYPSPPLDELIGALVSVARWGVGGDEDIDHGVLSGLELRRRGVEKQRKIAGDKWIRWKLKSSRVRESLS